MSRTASYADIEYALMHRRSARATLMPRYTPAHWWECDVCEVTESGYFREYEIKMSRADFRVDANKDREIFTGDYSIPHNQRARESKHGLLAAGDPRGPSAFYFVTPIGLLNEEDIPQWAGLIEIESRAHSNYPLDWIKRKAPRLHKIKAAPGIRLGMLGSAYGRLHAEWCTAYYRTMCQNGELKTKSILAEEAVLP